MTTRKANHAGGSSTWVIDPHGEITLSLDRSPYAWLRSPRLDEVYWPIGKSPAYQAPSIDLPRRQPGANLSWSELDIGPYLPRVVYPHSPEPGVNVNWVRPVIITEGSSEVDFFKHLRNCPADLKAQVPAKRKWRARGLHRREPAAVRFVDRCSCFLRQGLPALKSGPSPQSLTGAAVFIAGRAHCEMRDEWKSHLAGEDGKGLARNLAVRAAWGFIWSAVRYRLRDATGLFCRPLDVVLRSRGLSGVVWVPTLGVAVAIVRHDGFYGLVTYDTNLGAMVTGSYAAIKFGRWRRKVTPKPGRGASTSS